MRYGRNLLDFTFLCALGSPQTSSIQITRKQIGSFGLVQIHLIWEILHYSQSEEVSPSKWLSFFSPGEIPACSGVEWAGSEGL